jgi:hypothetical protein
LERYLITIIPTLEAPHAGISGPYSTEADLNIAAIANPIGPNDRFYNLIVDEHGIQQASVYHPHASHTIHHPNSDP